MSLGVGVTALSEEDAINLLRQAWPDERIASLEAINSFSDTDQNHVVPNLSNWFQRGIWFPQGYSHIAS